MKYTSTTTSVTLDANILINFLRIDRVSLLGQLHGYRFVLPEDVLQEITVIHQRACIDAEIKAGNLHLAPITAENMAALALFARLCDIMGRGEAACLALAATKGYHLASDEKRRFRREAVKLIGENRLLGTESLILESIRSDIITVAQADEYMAVLAKNGYKILSFTSFAERFNG